MNNFTGIGNLCTDVKFTAGGEGGQDKASFKVAFNRPGKDAGADFHWIKVWNGTAKACATYLAKGSKVGIQGSVRSSEKRDNDGNVVQNYTEINANRVEFLSPKSGDQPDSVEATTPAPSDDIPF